MAVRVLGAAMSHFGHCEGDLRSLTEHAVRDALADAELPIADVGMVIFGNTVEGVLRGQEMIRAEVLLRHVGLRGVPMLNVENACASSSSAFHTACMAVRSGAVDVVLVVGAEKLTHEVKARSFAAVATAVDLSEQAEIAQLVRSTLLGGDGPSVAKSPLMDLYAQNAAGYFKQWEVDPNIAARISVKNRWHGSLNPKAQFQQPVSEHDVVASRMISDPLRLLMCAPVGDGAAVVVVASESYARRKGGAYVRVESSAMSSNGADPEAAQPVVRAARSAYEQAGLGPDDIDVAEVHDACSPAELWLYDELGFCAPGDAAKLVAQNDTALGGRLPVNPSGGLIARGHPLGATGCAQLVELVEQLRGRAASRQVPEARVALAQNSGGILDRGDEAVAVVTILSRG